MDLRNQERKSIYCTVEIHKNTFSQKILSGYFLYRHKIDFSVFPQKLLKFREKSDIIIQNNGKGDNFHAVYIFGFGESGHGKRIRSNIYNHNCRGSRTYRRCGNCGDSFQKEEKIRT